jgi:hypothetical protein
LMYSLPLVASWRAPCPYRMMADCITAPSQLLYSKLLFLRW